MKDWKNGIIINQGKVGQGWIKPSDTDEGQIFTVVYACVCVGTRTQTHTHTHVRVGTHACLCEMCLLIKYFSLLPFLT